MRQQQLIELGSKVRAFVVNKIVPLSWEINPVSLECGCAIASYTLTKALHKVGQRATLVEWGDGWGHCWVEHRDLIIDITATQFDKDLPEVLIVKKKDYNVVNRSDGFLAKGRRAENDLKRWDMYQSPFTFLSEIEKFLTSVQHNPLTKEA